MCFIFKIKSLLTKNNVPSPMSPPYTSHTPVTVRFMLTPSVLCLCCSLSMKCLSSSFLSCQNADVFLTQLRCDSSRQPSPSLPATSIAFSLPSLLLYLCSADLRITEPLVSVPIDDAILNDEGCVSFLLVS